MSGPLAHSRFLAVVRREFKPLIKFHSFISRSGRRESVCADVSLCVDKRLRRRISRENNKRVCVCQRFCSNRWRDETDSFSLNLISFHVLLCVTDLPHHDWSLSLLKQTTKKSFYSKHSWCFMSHLNITERKVMSWCQMFSSCVRTLMWSVQTVRDQMCEWALLYCSYNVCVDTRVWGCWEFCVKPAFQL